jgi:hypothetical protein
MSAFKQMANGGISKDIYKEVEIHSPWGLISCYSESYKGRYLKQMRLYWSFTTHKGDIWHIFRKNSFY